MLGKMFDACLEVVWRFGETSSSIGTFRVKRHVFGMPWGAQMRLDPQWTEIGCSPFTIQTLPLSMHRKWTEIMEFVRKTADGKSCRDQLPTKKSSIEVRDTSIAHKDTNDLCRTN